MSIDPYKWGQKFHKSLKDYLNGIGNQQNHFITDARIVTALNLGGMLEKLADLGRTVAGTGATLIGVVDASERFTGESVEAVLNELQDNIEAIAVGGETFRIVSAFPATVASDDVILLVTASGSIPLPTPTAGRKLVIKSRASGDVTLTPSSGQIEQFDGTLDSALVLSAAGDAACIRGDGSNWYLYPG